MRNRPTFVFFLMMAVVCLLNVNYVILRSARNALTVADLGGGAHSIPWFELCGTMPGSILMTLGLTWMLNRFAMRKVFLISMGIFVSFFLLFAWGIYPLLPTLVDWAPAWMSSLLPKLASLSFFVMAELWKIALLTVLFWGFINQSISMEGAKKYYAPLMLGSSVGTVLANPIISFCTSDAVSGKSWGFSLLLLMSVLAVLSGLAGWFFSILSRHFTEPQTGQPKKERENLSLLESIKICYRSKYLLLLAWLTVADYIAYSLGEVIFFDVLRQKYPDPRQYCDFMGHLSLWSGVLTAISALVITPYLLRRCRWVVASLITPLCLLATEGGFFFALWHPSFSTNLELLVVCGSLFFCLVRAAKYTLFDTSKEISFLFLPPLEKMQGKLVIDGMCARLGRGSASFFSLALIEMCGGVLATVPIAGALAIGISASCVFATSKLGLLVEKAERISEVQ